MNKEFIRVVAVAFFAIALAGCGEKVSVEPGEVGKQLGTGGLGAELFKPGVFRLDDCPFSACPKLIRLQVNKAAVDLKIDSLFLPESNVDLTNVTVGIQFRVKPEKKWLNKVYEEVKPVNSDGEYRVMVITTDMVWDTFGKRKAPDAIITALRDYSVDEILVNVPEIAAFVKGEINNMLADTPIEVTELGFPNGIGEVPDEVRISKRKLFAIEDDKAREIRALAAALEVEEQRQAVARKRAGNDIEIAGKLDISVAQYQCLRALDSFADAANAGTSAIFATDCGLGAGVSVPLITKR